jgi:hypothetical protein
VWEQLESWRRELDSNQRVDVAADGLRIAAGHLACLGHLSLMVDPVGVEPTLDGF